MRSSFVFVSSFESVIVVELWWEPAILYRGFSSDVSGVLCPQIVSWPALELELQIPHVYIGDSRKGSKGLTWLDSLASVLIRNGCAARGRWTCLVTSMNKAKDPCTCSSMEDLI